MQESELYSRFGQRVRQHRERLDLNQAEIGRASGLSRASIANIETGRQRIPIHHLTDLPGRSGSMSMLCSQQLVMEPPTTIDREIQSAVELSERELEEVAKVVGLMTAGRAGVRCPD